MLALQGSKVIDDILLVSDFPVSDNALPSCLPFKSLLSGCAQGQRGLCVGHPESLPRSSVRTRWWCLPGDV